MTILTLHQALLSFGTHLDAGKCHIFRCVLIRDIRAHPQAVPF